MKVRIDVATKKKTKDQPKVTTVRKSLVETSFLLEQVVEGCGAIEKGHRDYFEDDLKKEIDDSLNLDEALRPGREKENRWDYLLGHEATGKVIAVEPHSAKQDEISTVIRKRKAATVQLQGHLKEGVRIDKWIWVASGKVHFVNTGKTALQLAQSGIKFVGRRIKIVDIKGK